eukprot:TRINITY_DN6133_c0_g1_i1.p2 TRINITY_DN6133_c0_g1~~TRINITY_DN6133_c0_g1_i1.p2  ORF type:complete len:113 (+),score=19.48 TRINITY_DN6133_c0_g1_i1:424-762(+)
MLKSLEILGFFTKNTQNPNFGSQNWQTQKSFHKHKYVGSSLKNFDQSESAEISRFQNYGVKIHATCIVCQSFDRLGKTRRKRGLRGAFSKQAIVSSPAPNLKHCMDVWYENN